jgi:hypothetical protein
MYADANNTFEAWKLWTSSLRTCLHSHATCLSDPTILVCTFFSNTSPLFRQNETKLPTHEKLCNYGIGYTLIYRFHFMCCLHKIRSWSILSICPLFNFWNDSTDFQEIWYLMIRSQPRTHLLLDSSPLFCSTNQHHQIRIPFCYLPYIRLPKTPNRCGFTLKMAAAVFAETFGSFQNSMRLIPESRRLCDLFLKWFIVQRNRCMTKATFVWSIFSSG